MNDQDLELLSAYLDGALPEAERRALEARLGASPEMRRELDELRAVAKAVKDLPREPLPPGFLARFSARRARGDRPRRDWVLLPPSMRPVAFALSTAIVALVVWDRVVTPPEPYMPSDSTAAKIVTPANAPLAPLDLAKQITAAADKKEADLLASQAATSAAEAQRREEEARHSEEKTLQSVGAVRGSAPGRPLAAGEISSALGGSGPAPAAAPAAAGTGGLSGARRATMSEEERSARNEEMFGYLEKEKKRMGIARVLPKDETAPRRVSVASLLRQGGFAEPETAGPAPGIAAGTPALLKTEKTGRLAAAPAPAAPAAAPAGAPAGRLSPEAGLVYTDARSLAASWVVLGFPGEPPQADFAENRVVLLKPSATKILAATPGPDAVTVTYRSLETDEASDPARDRVALIPADRRPVLFFDQTP